MGGNRKKRDSSPSVASTSGRTNASSAESMIASDTTPASSIEPTFLQDKGPSEAHERLEPLTEDDPSSFDLLPPDEDLGTKGFDLEARSDLLFSKEHLQAIFRKPSTLHKFTAFLSSTRPRSIPLLIYYLDALKAIRAVNYSNAVAEALEPIAGLEFTEHAARPTLNTVLEEKAAAAFDQLVGEDLPAYITHVWIRVATRAIVRRITGNMRPEMQEMTEGLAEVFCFTDVTRPDNPIIFASEEFHRTTQYGVSYAIGRNCRFLQGPRTNKNSTRRIRLAAQQGKEISEVFLNYRRDGSPFLNMLMMAPLHDSRGNLRYFIGAQIDISGLARECTDLDALQDYLQGQENGEDEGLAKDEFQELSEMFNDSELDSVRRYGGRMHREDDNESDHESSRRKIGAKKPRMLLHDSSGDETKRRIPETITGRLEGVYQHYLLLRPAPSLRILFTSPSLRLPGLLQSPFLDRIGGSSRVRSALAAALTEGRGVTAKVKWLLNPRNSSDEGRTRWIHATPLLDAAGRVGVWMVLLVDEDAEKMIPRVKGRGRPAPPVDPSFVPSAHGRERHGVASARTRETHGTPRNDPETDSIVLQSVLHSAGLSDAEPFDEDDDEDAYDSAPAPRIHNVARNQPNIVGGQTHVRSGKITPARTQSPHPNVHRLNGIGGSNAAPPVPQRDSDAMVTPRDGHADGLREHPVPLAKDHVRIGPDETPSRGSQIRSLVDHGMGQGLRGSGSVDSVAL